MVKVLHFTRIPGCVKKVIPYEWYPPHYTYYGENVVLNKEQKNVMVVLCNNCNPKHKSNLEECELMLDSHDKAIAVFIQLKRPQYSTYKIEEGDVLLSIIRDFRIQYLATRRPTELIFRQLNTTNPSSPVNNKKYFCIFSPSDNMTIKISRQPHDHIREITKRIRDGDLVDLEHSTTLTTLKYGWNIFYVCDYWNPKWDWIFLCRALIVPVHCDKLYFKMFILYETAQLPSLLNLCLSSLLQHNLNTALDKRKYILPKTLCEQAPPCHFYHLSPEVSSPNHCPNYCLKTLTSSFIYNW
jgi:hypothetical protein